MSVLDKQAVSGMQIQFWIQSLQTFSLTSSLQTFHCLLQPFNPLPPLLSHYVIGKVQSNLPENYYVCSVPYHSQVCTISNKLQNLLYFYKIQVSSTGTKSSKQDSKETSICNAKIEMKAKCFNPVISL